MSRFNGNAVGLKTDSAYELSWDKMKEITAESCIILVLVGI